MIETMMSKVFEQSTESLKKSFDLPNFFNNDCSTTSISNFKEADKPLLSEGTSLESNSIYRENGQSLETDDNGNREDNENGTDEERPGEGAEGNSEENHGAD